MKRLICTLSAKKDIYFSVQLIHFLNFLWIVDLTTFFLFWTRIGSFFSASNRYRVACRWGEYWGQAGIFFSDMVYGVSRRNKWVNEEYCVLQGDQARTSKQRTSLSEDLHFCINKTEFMAGNSWVLWVTFGSR